jgi:hypothetical protein
LVFIYYLLFCYKNVFSKEIDLKDDDELTEITDNKAANIATEKFGEVQDENKKKTGI